MLVNLASLAAAARRLFVVCALVSAALCSAPEAFAQNARNTANVAPPTGFADPVSSNNSAVDEDPIGNPQQLRLTKAHVGDFAVGSNGVYTLTLSNIGAVATVGAITVADTLPAGLTFVSATGTGWTCGAAGQDVTCTTNAVVNAGASAPAISLTVAVGPAAAPNVTNTARASGGGDATCPASGATQARCNPSDPTNVTTPPPIDFCAANTIYNVTQSASGATMVGGFYRFNLSGADGRIDQLNLPVAGGPNFNALMVDPIRNRLLVISYTGSGSTGSAQLWAYDVANGGWYKAAPLMTNVPDLPRAAMSPSGVGYLMAGNNNIPEVWSVTTAGAFDYTIASVGTLSFDIPPTATGSGDMAFDAGGNAWMSAGQDIYKINISTLDAERQQRPLLGGSPSTIAWAGVAFGSDGRLYLATNGSSNTYYALNLATGVLTLAGSNSAAPSQARDLGSCAFPPAPQPAQLRVQKTLGLVNGAPYTPGANVKPGDVLTYRIAISHVGGDLAATVFAGDVIDTLPANTARVAAGNDFNCTGSNCTNANAVNVAVGATQTLNFVVSVNNPLPGNVSSIVNAVTVKDVNCATAGNDCGETTPVAPLVTVAKASAPVSGTTVNPGQTINYTLTITVANSATTAPVILNDTLSAGLTAGAMPAGCAVAGQTITCTLAAGAAPGTHTFVYPATVAANATGSVSNSVVPSGTDSPTCAAGGCATNHPIVATAVAVSKASNPASGAAVGPGQTIQYTLSVDVANSATTAPVTLTDTLSAGQALGPMPPGCVAAGQVVTCTLAAGALPSGSPYTFVYSATVNANATGSVGNNVVPSGTDNPTCAAGACSTTHPIVAPAVTVSKASNPASGATVNPGQAIQYTLTVNVANSATTGAVTLTDTLSAGQTLGAMPPGCLASGQVVTCTLAAGALPSGSPYTFVYSATVDANATGSVGNAVVPSGTDNPTCAAGACSTTHPIVAPAVTVNKVSLPVSGTTVNPGDAIQYTLTVNVANSATTGAVTLTDTLSAGQTLGAMPPGCLTAGQVVTCTLAAGALPSGSPYTFVYSATVDASATSSVGNNVVPSGTDNPTCAAGACSTTHPIVAPAVTVSKASLPVSGTTVNPGDAIQYTLTVNVANSATTGAVTLTDTLSAGQTLGAMPPGCLASGQVVTCTLAAGALPSGSPYTFVYSATVDANATGSVGNNVVPSGTDNPTCAAGACNTTHPIVAPTVTVSKASNPASGSTVNPGDAIQYTLAVDVANSATTGAVTLTDTLSAGQTLGPMPPGCLASGQVVTCTLAAGALPSGSPYTFVYSATVNANATGSVSNAVVPSGTNNPSCGSCTTTHPITATSVTVVKSSNPASGSTVNPGDAIQYTLTVNVANSATTGPVTLTDTLSAGQTLGPMPPGCLAAGQVVTCTLAAGALPSGSPYTFVYSATVNANATGSVGNTVVPSGPDNPGCGTGGCTTTHPIVAPAVTVSKASLPVSGTTVNPGDAIQYTLSVNVANSATTGAVTLTDTLSAGQTLGPMPTGCVAAGQVVTCTLAAGALPSGNPHTFVYTATVNANATGSVGNNVVPSGTDNPTCVAGGCTTTHPIVAATVTVSKASSPISGTTVNPGDAIQYTLSVNVANSATTGTVTLTDTLSAGQTLGAMPPGCVAAGQVVTCTLAAGALPSGSPHTFVYTATVNANATGSVGNNVVPSGTDNPTCAAGACSTTHPIVAPAVTVSKASLPVSGTTVNPGDAIQYTLTVNVANSATTGAVTLTDTLSAGQTLGPMPAGCVAASQVVTCTLAAGALPSGSPYTFVYSATVNANATGSVGNNVVPSGTDNPTCVAGGCTTTHPIVAPVVTVSKASTPVSGTTVNPGQSIQYTLSVNVANSATTAPVTLADTLSAGQTLGAMPAGCVAAGQVVTCTVAAGALPSGSPYTFVYSATVNSNATGSIGNNVVPSGPDNPTCAAGACSTTHPIVPPVVTVSKSSAPASGTTVNPGQSIQYTLSVDVANSATTGAVTLTDTLSAGQTLGPMPPGCIAAGQVVTCTLPAGALPSGSPHTFVYSATVDANATGSVGNNVVPSGADNPTCAPGACSTTHPIVATAVTVSKASLPASGATVNPGDTIQYTLTVNVANSATTAAVTLTDTLSAGQTLGPLPAGCAVAGQVVTCTLAPGALPSGSPHTFVYSATVNANATGAIGNNVVPSGPDNPTCAPSGCATTHTIVPTAVTVSKASNPASGATVNPGDTIQYTLTVVVANSATTAPVTLTDTLSAGQTLGAPPPGCSAAGQVMTCVLGAGALPGSYDFAYAATVDANATGSIGNNVVPGGTDNPICAAGACGTTHTIVPTAVTVSKASNPASGSTVNPGDTIQYTLTVNVANSATTATVTLTDTLSAGQTLGALPAGCAAAGQVVTCTLAAGALPGGSPYTFVYSATVDANATGAIGNNVVPSGTDNPTCAAGACATTHTIVPSSVSVAKSSNPASGTPVNANATIVYTVTVTVASSATTTPVVLTDTLSGQQTLTGTPTVPAGGNCTTAGAGLQCTLAAGALPGDYAFVYQTVVATNASGSVGNVVVATGGGPNNPNCTNCSTTHPIAEPVVQVSKSSNPGNGVAVNIGDTIEYTLTVTVGNAAITQAVILTDTPGTGLTIGTLPSGCATNGAGIVCTLPAGSVPGTYTFAYPATVNADANGNVANAVVATGGSTTGGNQPSCANCATAHPVADVAQLRIVKQASPRDVKIGDLVRYTLTIENVSAANISDAILIDTPPAGFSYVADSLTVADADGAGRLVGTYPIRVDRLDVRAGEHATVQYLLRVGAGVRPGSHVNRAHAEDGGQVVSNEATAEVQLIADPLLDESLLIGTVFDDRDGDGWQDSAKLGGVKVQGGFAPSAYVAGSTTMDRGDGPQPQADASAPLLHGIDVGGIAARQSEAADAHAVVIAQTLSALDFTDDFALTSAQGFTVRMDAAGNTRVERSGEAAKGTSGADPQVERRIGQVDGGYRVEYVIRNAGIDERGIPGVRIASVEGLLIETDQYGRYHLEGVAGGPWERGRNFILKVDPATLPPGSQFTSDNPLVRRITPGVPVRFDFAVKLPSGLVEGGTQTVEMELGAVMFDADSAQLRAEYASVIEKMAEQVRAHGGGEVLIAANGETQALAYDRAKTVRDALVEKLSPEQAKALTVDLRADLDDPASSLVAVGESPVLGTVLFDTDQSRIKPEYAPLIDKIAADIERMKGGTVGVIGHADKRGGDAYNVALGLRRAKAVYDAVAAKLSPEVRARLRVDISDNPTAPVGMRGR